MEPQDADQRMTVAVALGKMVILITAIAVPIIVGLLILASIGAIPVDVAFLIVAGIALLCGVIGLISLIVLGR